MLKPSTRSSKVLLTVASSVLAVVALGCSSSHKTTNATAPTTSASTNNAPATTVAPLAATPTTAAPAGLSGTWSGHYSGAYSGTFTLTWQQSGPNLSGTIMISSFNNKTTSINGTIQGGSIRFGTVGTEAIQYSGTVSGSSMSGTWQIQAAGRSAGNGSWSASQS
jgi:hypothetical protein